MKIEREPKSLVYIPPMAKTNIENKPMAPPMTEYEEGKAVFDEDAVKNLVQGKYGKNDQSNITGL